MNGKDLIVEYFSRYMPLSPEEAELIREADIVKEYAKGDVLVEEGQIARQCYLVLKGCVKRYYLTDGEERIMEFYTENDPITPVSYIDKKPSAYFISCLEPCIISSGTEARTQEFLARFPHFIPIFIGIGDDLKVKKQASLDTFKNLSPEGRYRKLVATRPGLVNRVPQYMIASYLGIKPESLSRIRRRMSQES